MNYNIVKTNYIIDLSSCRPLSIPLVDDCEGRHMGTSQNYSLPNI